MKKNILRFEEWIFENESGDFKSFDTINEEYPYDQLKKSPTDAIIAKALYGAKGAGMLKNDKEAWAVAALQAIKSPEHLDKVSKELLKLNGGKMNVNQWIASFMEGGDLYRLLHNNSGVFLELERIYGIPYDKNKSPYNLYKTDDTFKDELIDYRRQLSKPLRY